MSKQWHCPYVGSQTIDHRDTNVARIYFALEFFHKGPKGEFTKRGGDKTKEFICKEPWRISTGHRGEN